MNKNSLVFQTDSYKVSHWLQFPKGSQRTSYYIESRGGSDELMFFGLQAIIKKLLVMPTVDEVITADKFWREHGIPYFNKQGWLDLIKLGYFPLTIKAIPEGMRVKTKTPLITIENTVDGFHWLPGWLETRLLQVWYPITVASKIDKCKQVIYDNYQRTGELGGLEFKLHSFGYRGVSSEESAEIGGMAELVSFMGTDTISGVIGLEKYYNNRVMSAFSIPAAEHSTMTSWGKEGEFDAYRNMIKQFGKPNSLMAVVSDSYDLSNAVRNGWCGELKQEVLDSGVTLVVRPDSGEPKEVVMRTLKELGDGYGYTANSKGFKTLNGVRIIHGDGINGPESIKEILDLMEVNGWSVDNVAFGMGGGSLQQVNRDTLKFAMKCSAIMIDNTWKDVYKEPSDAPWKASKKGRQDCKEYVEVFLDGDLKVDYNFSEVRARASEYFK